MFRHLLVPVECTDACVEAIGQAVEFALSIGARITFFFPLPARADGARRGGCGAADAASSANRAWEWLAKAEGAAHAQGVTCASVYAVVGAPEQAVFAVANERDCDLICRAADSPRAGSGTSGGAAAAASLPVLTFATGRQPAADRAIGQFLREHRAFADALHAWRRLVRDAGASPDTAQMRRMFSRLWEMHSIGRGPMGQARPFSMLRERTSARDAELDELERQVAHEAELLDELSRLIERAEDGGIEPVQLEQAVTDFAQFVWERMGREEGVILPAARRCFSDADWQDIEETLSANAAAVLAVGRSQHICGPGGPHADQEV